MPDTEQKEPLRQRVILLILDKFILAAFIVALGAFATLYADRLKTVWSFQEDLFERRLSAYTELMNESDKVLNSVADYYGLPYDSSPVDSISEKISHEQNKIASFRSGFSGGSISFITIDQVVEALHKLAVLRRRHSLLIPEHLDVTLSGFMGTIVTLADKEIDQEIASKSSGMKPMASKSLAENKDWQEVKEFHGRLKREFRTTLGLDQSPSQFFLIHWQ